jgi:hypothetical protein
MIYGIVIGVYKPTYNWGVTILYHMKPIKGLRKGICPPSYGFGWCLRFGVLKCSLILALSKFTPLVPGVLGARLVVGGALAIHNLYSIPRIWVMQWPALHLL